MRHGHRSGRERGRVERLILLLVVGVTVGGVIFMAILPRTGPSGKGARLYRFKNERGQMVYVNSLEKVPASQRDEAANAEDVRGITTADYDAYVDGYNRKEEAGMLDWLKRLFSSRESPARTLGSPTKGPRTAEGGGKSGKEENGGRGAPGLTTLNPAEMGRQVRDSFEATGRALGQ